MLSNFSLFSRAHTFPHSWKSTFAPPQNSTLPSTANPFTPPGFLSGESKRVEFQGPNASVTLLVSTCFGFPKIQDFSQASQRCPQVAVFQRGPTIVAGWSLYVDFLSSEKWRGPR